VEERKKRTNQQIAPKKRLGVQPRRTSQESRRAGRRSARGSRPLSRFSPFSRLLLLLSPHCLTRSPPAIQFNLSRPNRPNCDLNITIETLLPPPAFSLKSIDRSLDRWRPSTEQGLAAACAGGVWRLAQRRRNEGSLGSSARARKKKEPRERRETAQRPAPSSALRPLSPERAPWLLARPSWAQLRAFASERSAGCFFFFPCCDARPRSASAASSTLDLDSTKRLASAAGASLCCCRSPDR
jgi:hypothetical protein